ncbi:MAG: TIM barrel protein, partial [Spirochaetales bacterium]|nr:TIM barrel protein [Spirochaetales bacterium]
MTSYKLGLNRIASPGMKLENYIAFASDNGFEAVELRNDLGDGEITDGMSAEAVRDLSIKYGVKIAAINALQRFNDREETLPARTAELRQLLKIAKAAGIEAVVLCPVNDKPEPRSEQERMEDTVRALKTYGSLFKEYGIFGYIEPLGFVQCSLRFKKQAVEAIEKSGFAECYKLVHDTFHHYLAEETELYPEYTGIVHMSGVLPGKDLEVITDADRILVTDK